MRKLKYPGSELVIEENLGSVGPYTKYIASYYSEGFKNYGLLTVPSSDVPNTGWPVIIFNHGYISPYEYRTTERYVAYVDVFARNGYIVFKPDYRGHGNSEGEPEGGYGSPAYTVDVLNAVSSLKKYKDADPARIGMWGHSLGGNITLRSMVVSKDIKVGVIWAGVVASYADLLNNWRRVTPPAGLPTRAGSWRRTIVTQYGSPEQNPEFWNSISPIYFVKDISGPLQIHHGTADTSVPVSFSENLRDEVIKNGKTAELFVYEGDDHNISNNFNFAMQRSVEFFDKYLK